MTSIFKQLETLTPVAEGGFSELYIANGYAVKLLEDQDYVGVLKESYLQNMAAEQGLAPKIHAVARQGEKVVVVMDYVDTDIWYHADAGDDVVPTLMGELNDREMLISLKLYCRLLKCGIIHADAHSGNIFMNDDGEAIAIDFGLASEIHEAPKTHLMRSLQFVIPCLERMGQSVLADDLREAWSIGLEVTRDELVRVADIIA